MAKTKKSVNLSLDILKWRSRRGMLELDLILIDFIGTNYDNLSQDELLAYHYLLEQKDTDLFSWFVDGIDCPDEFIQNICKKIKAYWDENKN